VDREVGEFLDSLDKKLLDRTIVVIFSEHGEMFARHGRFGRSGTIRGTLYDDVVHVPLAIRIPGVKGRRVRGLVQIVDIMPTLMQIMDAPISHRIQGTSLLPLMNKNKAVNEFVYAGAIYNTAKPEAYAPYDIASINESIRNDEWKLIHEIKFLDSPEDPASGSTEETFELYDLKKDPYELVNSAAAYPDTVNLLKGKLEQWAESSRKFMQSDPSTRNIPEEVRENAKKHGYW
ncbi:MAG: sulfatase/phosphatase domain-containing protein, partial [bacterium]